MICFGLSRVSSFNVNSSRNSFLGKTEQIPPMYSALKHKGKSLYKYARKGETINRDPRQITVHRFDIMKIELPDVYFEMVVSKGTYIRVVADDFGKKLGCGGYLKSLRRTAIGEFNVNYATTIRDFEKVILGGLDNF